MTYPKRIVSKTGAILGYSNVKYPKSIYEENLERQRNELKSASIHSPVTKTRRGSRLSSAEAPVDSYSNLHILEPVSAAQVESDMTHQVSGDISAFIGWEVGQPTTSIAQSRALSTQVVQSTRVGGATFVTKGLTAADEANAAENEK